MRETLYIRLRQPEAGAITAYAVVAEAIGGAPGAAPPSVFVREAPLADIIRQVGGRKLVVFVPGAEVRLTQVKVPARQPAKVLQAAPFVLEDQLAEDLETLHFALGPRQADGAFPVAVVSHAHMHEWLAPFREQQALPDALVPETLALPWEEGGPWSVLPEADHLTARTGAYAGFSCVPEDFELFLQMAESGTPHALRVLVPQGAQEDYTRLQRPLELLPGFGHPLEALVRHLRLKQAVNLLQARYSQRESLDRFWRPWRFAAGLIAAAFLLGIVVNSVEAVRLQRAAKAQEASNEDRFSQFFPGLRVPAVSLSTQVEQENVLLLKNGSGQGNPLQLLQQAADSLAATPGLTLNSAEFRDSALYLDLGGSDLQVLEQLRTWYNNHHCAHLDVQSADSGEGGVKIRLKLTAGKC